MRDCVWLGPTPANEDCAQVGQDDYRERAIPECRAYIEAIRRKCGEPPEGACLRVKSQPHDFGTYYEVACEFDADNREAMEYAYRVEDEAPLTWGEVNLEPPAAGKGRSR